MTRDPLAPRDDFATSDPLARLDETQTANGLELPTPLVDMSDLVGEVTARTGIQITDDDPLLAFVAMHEIYLRRFVEAQREIALGTADALDAQTAELTEMVRNELTTMRTAHQTAMQTASSELTSFLNEERQRSNTLAEAMERAVAKVGQRDNLLSTITIGGLAALVIGLGIGAMILARAVL